MEIDNCLVCDKHLKDIGEQETLMCNECYRKTNEIAKEQKKALNIHNVIAPYYCEAEHNFMSRCNKMCKMCNELQD